MYGITVFKCVMIVAGLNSHMHSTPPHYERVQATETGGMAFNRPLSSTFTLQLLFLEILYSFLCFFRLISWNSRLFPVQSNLKTTPSTSKYFPATPFYFKRPAAFENSYAPF